jgi:phosphate transport system substrate-binding protein
VRHALRPLRRGVRSVLCNAALLAAATALLVTRQTNGDQSPPGSAAARTLSYEGATTIGTNILPEVAALFRERTGVAFSSIGGSGADAGFKAAVEGRATFGGVARELTSEEKARVGGSEVIGFDVMGVFVNAGNPVGGLTRAELREIFAGRATNWRQFKGPDRAITVYSEKLSGGRATVKAFRDMVLGGDPYGPVKELEDATDCVRDVAADEGGITASSMSFAIPGVRALVVDGSAPTRASVQSGAYPLKRPLILVTRDAPAGDAKAFLDFMLAPEAQAIVARKFVPVR